MSADMLFVLQWYGAAAAAIAAFTVALDLGRRPTGWAFVLFVTSSVAFILYGFLDPRPEEAIASLNVMLFFINLIGVWHYLLSPKNKRKMEAVDEAVEKFEEKEAAA